MSFRRGGGGGNNNSFNIPLGLGYQDILLQSQLHNSEVPQLPLPVNNTVVNRRERDIASFCMSHLNDVSDSVFNLGDIVETSSSNKLGLIENDNSNDIERYGDRYLKLKKGTVQQLSLDDHPFSKDLFPEELFNVMGFNKKKKHLQLKKLQQQQQLLLQQQELEGGEDGEGGQDKAGLSMLEKLKELAEEVGNVGDDDDDDDENNKEGQRKPAMEDIDEDEDFEEDEDDDDDYNAEKYFNDGDDDDDGYGDAGDDDEPAF